jgi:hypothetical protein
MGWTDISPAGNPLMLVSMPDKSLTDLINDLTALGDTAVLRWALRTFEILEDGYDIGASDLEDFIARIISQ